VDSNFQTISPVPSPKAILWVICWESKIPSLPPGFEYRRTLVSSSLQDVPVVFLLASTTLLQPESVDVSIFLFLSNFLRPS
jgi:hypothetical protein